MQLRIDEKHLPFANGSLEVRLSPLPPASQPAPTVSTLYSAIALYDFSATSSKEMSFFKGQELRIRPGNISPGWVFGTLKTGKEMKSIPEFYVQRTSGK